MHTISFLQKQVIVMHHTRQTHEPKYAFITDLDCRSFQRFVRNRELLGVFDINTITCATGKLAEFQHLKIWRIEGGDDKPTISFFADRLDYDEGNTGDAPAIFCEAHLRWFESAPRLDAPNVLRLALNRKNNEAEARSPRRRFSFRRRSSGIMSPESPRPSISVAYMDLLYDSINATLLTPDEDYEEMEFLEIEFTKNSDAHRFIRISRNAHPRSSLGSHVSLSLNDQLSPPSSTPRTPHARSASTPSIAESPEERSTSAPSLPTQNGASERVPLASSASASINTSMPPTPALTERSFSTTSSSTSGLGLQIWPSLPSSLHDFQWDPEKHEFD
ncbi:hypothetical protein EJ04DRAFT_86397 [Polyplosphaeria fusca]|uniref:Uncharacterized protein n=1 Tax=Polyplosphaeria fusca TaxID=682080 RepID=A0A9P4UXC2_9PLEO|nr:hypothetical protein EJ04DRAFT_86397 [Polyplosphaeria fusca]